MPDHDIDRAAVDLHRHDTHRGRQRTSSSMRHFVRHYAEMVVAMFLGMAVLGVPAGWALVAAGSSWSAVHHDAPALSGHAFPAPGALGWNRRMYPQVSCTSSL